MIQANTWPKTTRIAGGRDRAIPLVHYGQLSGAEWEIVELARWDGPRSLNPDGLLARLQRILFGAETPRPLANKRLETLRRFSVEACRNAFPVATASPETIAAYDVRLRENAPMTNRTSYLIAPDGRIIYAYSNMDWHEHVPNTLAALRAWRARHR